MGEMPGSGQSLLHELVGAPWPCASLSDGGAMLADDIDQSRGFHAWFEGAAPAKLVIGTADDHRALLAVVRKDPSVSLEGSRRRKPD